MNAERTIAERIASKLIADDPLHSILRQTGTAYGSVAGALETLAGYIERGQESETTGRKAFAELVDAIHAPRDDAQRLAVRLQGLAREVTHKFYD